MTPPPSIPQPSNHPTRCEVCTGSGYQPAQPIVGTVEGRPHTWTTLAPCTHDWWHDDTGYNPTTDEELPWSHPKARAAYERGYAQGQAELYDESGGQYGQPQRKEPT